jgi:hypothetical protein
MPQSRSRRCSDFLLLACVRALPSNLAARNLLWALQHDSSFRSNRPSSKLPILLNSCSAIRGLLRMISGLLGVLELP